MLPEPGKTGIKLELEANFSFCFLVNYTNSTTFKCKGEEVRATLYHYHVINVTSPATEQYLFWIFWRINYFRTRTPMYLETEMACKIRKYILNTFLFH
jgi:hypothetical protein